MIGLGKSKKSEAPAPEKEARKASKKPETAKKDSTPRKEAAGKAATAKDYATIIRPVITEKATQASAHGAVVFQVSLTATKNEVRDAVQNLFKVKVLRVNTTRRKGKIKNFRGRASLRRDTKLAYVTLAEGQNIDVSAGI